MPQQGDWKDLFRAASEGNVAEMAYYLDDNVRRHQIDVNFQHPEYMSSILCAAARAGHVAAVSLLLSARGGADPFLPEDWSDQYPLQLARDAHHHDVVDVLLDAMTMKIKKMNENNDDDMAMSAAVAAAASLLSNIVQTIWVDTDDVALVAAVARRGHRVIWPTATATQLSHVQTATLNRKIFDASQLLLRNNDNDNNDDPIIAMTTTTKMTGAPPVIIHVAFLDNRYDDDNEHADGRGSKVFDRLLRLLPPPPLPNEEDTSVAGTGLPSPLQPVQLSPSRWKFSTMPPPPKRLILARRPTTEPMTIDGDLVPYDVVLPTTTRHLSSWWWSSSWWSLISYYFPYFDGGAMTTTSFVDAAVAAIFPVVPPRHSTTSWSDGNYHVEF